MGGSVSITGNFPVLPPHRDFPVLPPHREFSGGTGIFRSTSLTGNFPVPQGPAKGTRPSPGFFRCHKDPPRDLPLTGIFPVAPGFSGAKEDPPRDPPPTGIFRFVGRFPCMRLHMVMQQAVASGPSVVLD